MYEVLYLLVGCLDIVVRWCGGSVVWGWGWFWDFGWWGGFGFVVGWWCEVDVGRVGVGIGCCCGICCGGWGGVFGWGGVLVWVYN